MNERSVRSTSRARLWGLVLCGGRGSRLGCDKGALVYHGRPQAQWAHALLLEITERAYLSVRPDQQGLALYAELPLIADRPATGGPAAGLLAAWDLSPDVAWLLLATDMPLVDRALLRRLVDRREGRAVATAYRHADGTPEPLCAIWEPAARAPIEQSARSGSASLRRILESAEVKLLDLPDPAQLTSVNTPGDDKRVKELIARRPPSGPEV